MALSITSFTPGTGTITLGSSTILTAVFSGGFAVVLPGNIPVNSGSPITVTPNATTTYTLLLQDGTGATATAQVTITVTIQATRALGVGSSGGVIVDTNSAWIKGQAVYNISVIVNPFSMSDHISRANDAGVMFDVTVNGQQSFQLVGLSTLTTFLGQFGLTWA